MAGGFCLDAQVDRDHALSGEFDGIADQVEQDLADAQGIAEHILRQVGGQAQAQFQPLALALRNHQAHHVADDRAECHGLLADEQLAGVEARHFEDVAQYSEQGARRIQRNLDGTPGLLFFRRHQRDFTHADDAVHRRAQLVAHVGEKFALGAVCSLGGLLGLLQAEHDPVAFGLAGGQRLLGLVAGGEKTVEGGGHGLDFGAPAHRHRGGCLAGTHAVRPFVHGVGQRGQGGEQAASQPPDHRHGEQDDQQRHQRHVALNLGHRLQRLLRRNYRGQYPAGTDQPLEGVETVQPPVIDPFQRAFVAGQGAGEDRVFLLAGNFLQDQRPVRVGDEVMVGRNKVEIAAFSELAIVQFADQVGFVQIEHAADDGGKLAARIENRRGDDDDRLARGLAEDGLGGEGLARGLHGLDVIAGRHVQPAPPGFLRPVHQEHAACVENVEVVEQRQQFVLALEVALEGRQVAQALGGQGACRVQQNVLALLDLVVQVFGQGAEKRELLLLDPGLKVGAQGMELCKRLRDQEQDGDGSGAERQFELEAERGHDDREKISRLFYYGLATIPPGFAGFLQKVSSPG